MSCDRQSQIEHYIRKIPEMIAAKRRLESGNKTAIKVPDIDKLFDAGRFINRINAGEKKISPRPAK